MRVSLKQKIWKRGLDLTENTLESLYRDKSFLKLSSMSLNMNLWLKKSYGKNFERLLKGLDLPNDEKHLVLLESLHQLENQNDANEDRIKELEKEIVELKVLINRPQRTSRIRKKQTSATA
jgi:hypothetical protein